jgi:hypothetical protein
MPKRVDLPLGGMRRKLGRQQAEGDARDRKRKLDRVAEALERRSRSLGQTKKTWGKALISGRAPFPRRD